MYLRKLIRDSSGAAAVEFALLSMGYMTMLLGVIEVARYVADKQDLMSAVHSAGRYAIVHGSSSSSPASVATLEQMIGANLFIINAASITANASFSPNNSPGSKVTITANYTWVPLVSLLHLPTTTISATSAATILN
jgi:Flp pilus assembly protein TadG